MGIPPTIRGITEPKRITPDRNKRVFLFAFVAIIVYGAAVHMLSAQFLGWLSYLDGSEDGIVAAARYDGGNAEYNYMLGRYYDFGMQTPDPERAIQCYRASIRKNPFHADVWADLSRVAQVVGRDRDARAAMEAAVALGPNDPDIIWEAAMFMIRGNRVEDAAKFLRRYVLLASDQQEKVYGLCRDLGFDNLYTLGQIVPSSYPFQASYLAYLIKTKQTAESAYVWSIMDKEKTDTKVFISYVDFLIQSGDYEQAESAWSEHMKNTEYAGGRGEGNLIWNPGFESEILNGGFDWRLGSAKGVDIFIDDTIRLRGDRSLAAEFEGENPDIVIASQVVQVAAVTNYQLRASVKTDGISTKSGVYIGVKGHRCDGFEKRSESLTGTNFWKEVSLDFKVPDQCRAVTVEIGRDRSLKLANRITGTAWIDGVGLAQNRTISSSRIRP